MASACDYCGEEVERYRAILVHWMDRGIHCFCSTTCRHEYFFLTLNSRTCAREGCDNKVPKANRMLCLNCYLRADTFGETVICFTNREKGNWQRKERELINRLEGHIRVFSSKNMTQAELRALVPSIQKGERKHSRG
jgi:ribosomal protein L24E